MKILSYQSLDAKLLRLSCDLFDLDFQTTEDIPDLDGFVGQQRALTATRFGIDINRDGYNIFALGPSGVGKRSIVLSLLEKEAIKKSAPPDICYTHNFKDARYPKIMLLDAGLGKKIADDMHQLVEILRVAIPATFESDAFTTRIKEIQEEGHRKQENAFNEMETEAEQQGLAILRTPDGFMLAALKDGKVLEEEEFQALPKEERMAKEAQMKELHVRMQKFLEKIPLWQRELREKSKEAVKYFTMLQVGSVIDDVRKRYGGYQAIADYLNEVQQAILDNPSDFRKAKEGLSGFMSGFDETSFNRYQINVLVDNSEVQGAPIIREDLPTFANLVGRVDHISRFGALSTDFTLIRPGALQRANGGYLLIDAIKLLSQPYAWEGLKRALRAKIVRVENFYQVLGYMSTITIEPQPLPLNVKVVLFGDRMVYYLLCALDHEFLELFKVAADFDEDIAITKESCRLFAQLIKNLTKRHDIRPLSKSAVIAMHEHGVRLANDTKKVSTHVRKLTDLLREADHYAQQNDEAIINHQHIEHAIEQQIFRASRLRERHYEHIARGVILIDCTGYAVGQINGLSYLELGGFAFGQPSRITARVGMGNGRIIDIEREVKLGGPIHSKGVLILVGYLSGQFGKEHAISLSASLVFEQSYGGVEGDSATAAEACALISAIAKIPLSQSIAITGSMNQHGEIQAIGGVNEKIEGFYDICAEKGLTGDQGVIIPHANIEHLMLRKDIAEAASLGRFHIFAIKTVDDALSILTGKTAGARDARGKFPPHSLNALVETALINFAKKADAARKRKTEEQ